MPFKTRERQITITEVELDGHWFSQNEVFDIMDSLESSCYDDQLIIYNLDLAQVLKKLNAVNQSSNGGYYKGAGWEQFAREVRFY